MNISTARASIHERAILEQLLQLCLHDYTSYAPRSIGEDGRFEYRWLESYWQSADRHPYLLRRDNELAGFVLVRSKGEDEWVDWQWQIAEFFILRGSRGHKVGTAAALEILRNCPGLWEISYDSANEPARLFWASIVKKFDPNILPTPAGSGKERFLFKVLQNPK